MSSSLYAHHSVCIVNRFESQEPIASIEKAVVLYRTIVRKKKMQLFRKERLLEKDACILY